MKRIYNKILLTIAGFSLMVACTSDFDEINKRPGAITNEEASARYFLTNVQFQLFGPDRFPYWRAQLIHADRYAGHFTFGFNGCWWTDELGYSYSSGYTDATYGWLEGYFRGLDNFLKITAEGGEFENEKSHAVGLIMKGLYYQLFTDTFGEVPYSEAGDPDIVTPKFDTQENIYQGIIEDLNTAMDVIGDSQVSGDGVEDLGDNDLYYNGDLQKWKKLANTLKLRVALRAYGAPGADFAESAINEALSAPLIETQEESALLPKDTEISQWSSAAYGDVWHNFGGIGSKWTVSKPLIDLLRSNDDPRLSRYAKPALGGEFDVPEPADAADQKALDLMLSNLDDAGVTYTVEDAMDGDTPVKRITMDEETYYVGQPNRLNITSYYFAHYNMFSTPADVVINPKNDGDISPELVMTAGEAYLLRAEAAVLGFGGDANTLYQEGIRQAMMLWGVGEDEISTYLADSPLGSLTGTNEDMMRMISTQRWIAAYTDGFEAWSVVRKSGYPENLADGVDDPEIYGFGDIGGRYPQRMKYGNQPKDNNGQNLSEALERQGADEQDTKLWWARD